MKARIERNSGASGQISPLLVGRGDLVKQQTGDEKVSNYIVLPEGPRTRRSGTKFIGPLKDETRPVRFIEFDAGPGDTYMLAINGGVIRFYKNDILTVAGSPYEVAHPWTDAQLPGLFPAQSQDVIFIASGGKPKRLTRYADTNWVLDDYPYVQGPVRLQNADKAVKITASGTSGSITLTATGGTPFAAGHVGSVWKLEEQDFSTPAVWKALETPLALGQRRRYKSKIYEVVALNGSATGDAGPNPPTHDEGDFFSSAGNVTWRYISDSFGYVKITGFTSATQVTATVITTLPASVQSAGTWRWWEAAWSDVRGWPTSVSISDQSLVWAKTNTGNVSSPTDIYDFSITVEDDSAIEFTLISPDGKRTDIQWMIPAGIIIAGATSSEWIVRGTANIYDKLTATTLKAIRQGSKGSAPHVPALIDEGAIAIGRDRRSAYFVKFDAVSEQVQIQELTTYSRFMLKGKAQQVVAQSDPYRQVFFRDASGLLISLAFVPNEDVAGWAQHPLKNGKVIEIGSKQATDESHTELWLCVERLIDGQTRRYIEVMQPYFDALDDDAPTAEGAWFVDCGKTYSGAASATITGAGHLEGQEVAVFCNGQEFARRTVTGGQFPIERPMTGVTYGLPIVAEIISLPFETQVNFGTTRGSTKTASRMHLDLYQSVGGAIGTKGGQMADIPRPADLAMGSPMPLASGIQSLTAYPETAKELQLRLLADNALPSTLRAWIPDADIKEAP